MLDIRVLPSTNFKSLQAEKLMINSKNNKIKCFFSIKPKNLFQVLKTEFLAFEFQSSFSFMLQLSWNDELQDKITRYWIHNSHCDACNFASLTTVT